MNTKVRKLLNLFLQLGIILFAYGYLFRHVFTKMNITELIELLKHKIADPDFAFYFFAVLFLMLVNIGIEALKWRFMINKFERISVIRAYKAVLSGVTVSVFTPNRIGEYFGRVFILKHLHPFKGVIITFIGSMGQLLATVVIGCLCFLFFFPAISDIYQYPTQMIYFGMVIATLILLVFLIILYLNFQIVSGFFRRWIPDKYPKLNEYTSVMEHYNSAELLNVFALSLLRYFVFTTQFILLLIAFDVSLPLTYYFIVIPVIFLVITVIPTIALSELGIRGSVSIFLFQAYIHQTFGVIDIIAFKIVAASTLLWLINLAIPAVTGTLFVFNLKFIRVNNTSSP